MENVVESCPQNITEIGESSRRLGCGQDRYGNDQYICVPNIDKTGLIELCYNGIMAIIERGNCLRTTEGQLYRTGCLQFSSGCPDEAYRSNKIYLYHACQNINTQDRCYFAEPSCPNTTESISTVDTTEASNLGLSTIQSIYNTTSYNVSEGTLPQESNDSTEVFVWSVVAVVFFIILILAGVLWKRKQKDKRRTLSKSEAGEINIQYKKEDIPTEPDCKSSLLSRHTELTDEPEERVLIAEETYKSTEVKEMPGAIETSISTAYSANDTTDTNVDEINLQYKKEDIPTELDCKSWLLSHHTKLTNEPEERVLIAEETYKSTEVEERPGAIETGISTAYSSHDTNDTDVEHETLLPGETTETQEIVNTTEQIDQNPQEQIANKTGEQSDKNTQDHPDNTTQKQIGNSMQKETENNTQDHGGEDREIESTSPAKLPRSVTGTKDKDRFVERYNDLKTKLSAENEILVLVETTKSQVDATEQIDHNSQEQIANKTDEQSDKNAQNQLGNRTQERTGNSPQKEIDNNTQDPGGKDGKIESTSPSKPPRGVTDPEYEDHFVGKYSAWKTKISDEFSTLTDDEVSVLFCFLCSDSGPPDFTDTEWVDLLNEIRQEVYCYRNPVTCEEAQQTLDRLKSRDYLWEDQDKITKDTKDETMYRIASIDRDISFYYSSYDTASVYLRSRGYNRKSGEKCVISPGYRNHLLIRRLQMNILTHVTMEDTSIYKEIQQIFNIPENKIKKGKDERENFLTELRREGEAVHYRRSQDSVDHVTWLWRDWRPDIVRSCIGLHPHWDLYIIDNKTYRKPRKIHSYEPEVRCQLYCLLISDKYRIRFIEQSHRIKLDKIRQRYFPDITDDGFVDVPDGITETRDGVMTFISDDIRHDVMFAFVTECLVKDSDLEFFLTTASRDVVYEYCRLWDYKRSEGERCLYVPNWPEKMYDLFIDSLQLDIITHCTMSDERIHSEISERLGVPEEILKWDLKARERYVEYAKRGTQTVHHARGMIVGCAGAGKTTLLKRLLGCSEEEIKEVKSTEGLEVHEEIFDICDQTKSLKARNINTGDKYEESSATNIDSKTLTFFDFGGQCAYYACHQIYLTRRAFYVVVVDASKRLDQKVDKAVCDQDGSVFSGWTYGDYFVFWIKSIHTYCGSEKGTDPKPTVLIVVTHWEEGNRQYQSKEALLNSLQHIFSKSTNLSMYITEDNVYFISFPLKPLQDLEKIVFDIALHQRWKENIPKEWAFFEIEINQRKHNKKILEVNDLTTKLSDKGVEVTLKQYEDMLRYYHDAGKVLYFNEDQLKEYVIIDVQWFIDAFKYIITDKLHFKGIDAVQEDWDEYYTTGNLKDGLLAKIWEHKGDITYNRRQEMLKYFRELDHYWKSDLVRNMGNLLLIFMQRLGLVALGQESHYVPCMNRKEMEEELLTLIKNSESKSSVLIYRFTFLPFFLFFRLVVACMQETGWKVLTTHGTSCLYKDAAFFLFEGYHVVLSVTEESIQLQVLHSMPRFDLEADKTQKIQEKIENILNDFVRQFNRNLLFIRGVICHMENAKITAKDIKENFLLERDIPKDDQDILCPLHQVINRHIINPKELTKYWNM